VFTGLIKDIGTIVGVQTQGDGRRLKIRATAAEFSDIKVDESISNSGVCLTVTKQNGMEFDIDAVAETLKKTTVGTWTVGSKVNLERAVRPVDRLGGHYVQGHIDCVGEILSVAQKSNSWMIRVRFDKEFMPFIVPVGSIAIDGISLTVAATEAAEFTVAIIPYTYEHTTLNGRKAGDKVNLEFDILGKYIAKQLSFLTPALFPEPPLTEARLKELGY
jgi:riboflavin synthase